MKGIYPALILFVAIIVGLVVLSQSRSVKNERFNNSSGEVYVFDTDGSTVNCKDNEAEKCLSLKVSNEEETFDNVRSIKGFMPVVGEAYKIQVKSENNSYNLLAMLEIKNPNPSILKNEQDFPVEKVAEKITELRTNVSKQGIEGGYVVKSGDTVRANYRGWTAIDGVIFDQSFRDGASEGITFSLNSVIEGWQEGLVGMKIGEIRRLYIPAAQAYGESGSGSIAPNSDLIFDVELMGVVVR